MEMRAWVISISCFFLFLNLFLSKTNIYIFDSSHWFVFFLFIWYWFVYWFVRLLFLFGIWCVWVCEISLFVLWLVLFGRCRCVPLELTFFSLFSFCWFFLYLFFVSLNFIYKFSRLFFISKSGVKLLLYIKHFFYFQNILHISHFWRKKNSFFPLIFAANLHILSKSSKIEFYFSPYHQFFFHLRFVRLITWHINWKPK